MQDCSYLNNALKIKWAAECTDSSPDQICASVRACTDAGDPVGLSKNSAATKMDELFNINDFLTILGQNEDIDKTFF